MELSQCFDCKHLIRGDNDKYKRPGYFACAVKAMYPDLSCIDKYPSVIDKENKITWLHYETAPLEPHLCISFHLRWTEGYYQVHNKKTSKDKETPVMPDIYIVSDDVYQSIEDPDYHTQDPIQFKENLLNNKSILSDDNL